MLEDYAMYDFDRPGKMRRLTTSKVDLTAGRASITSQTVSHAITMVPEPPQNGENPQDAPSMICEPEIRYLISMLKQKSDKWEQPAVLQELHT